MAKFAALLILSLLAISMIQTMVLASEAVYQLDANRYGPGSVKRYQCDSQCSRRCNKTKHRKESCMEFCKPCCYKCLCVPPGYSGNKAVCPCYNNWKNKSGGPKCP